MIRYIMWFSTLSIVVIALYFVVGIVVAIAMQKQDGDKEAEPIEVVFKWPFYLNALMKRKK